MLHLVRDRLPGDEPRGRSRELVLNSQDARGELGCPDGVWRAHRLRFAWPCRFCGTDLPTPVHDAASAQRPLAGRLVGALVVSLLVFTAIPLGLFIGTVGPTDAHGAVHVWTYVQPHLSSPRPALHGRGVPFHGAPRGASCSCICRVCPGRVVLGANRLIQGNINDFWLALFDPFGLRTSAQVTKHWTLAERMFGLFHFRAPCCGIALWAGSPRLRWPPCSASSRFPRRRSPTDVEAAKGHLSATTRRDRRSAFSLLPLGSEDGHYRRARLAHPAPRHVDSTDMTFSAIAVFTIVLTWRAVGRATRVGHAGLSGHALDDQQCWFPDGHRHHGDAAGSWSEGAGSNTTRCTTACRCRAG